MSRTLTARTKEQSLKNAIERAKVQTKTLMNFSHLWTSHGFNLLQNCLFEYSHSNAEPRCSKTHNGEINERLIISFRGALNILLNGCA